MFLFNFIQVRLATPILHYLCLNYFIPLVDYLIWNSFIFTYNIFIKEFIYVFLSVLITDYLNFINSNSFQNSILSIHFFYLVRLNFIITKVYT